MSKIIISAAIRGAYKIVGKAAAKLDEAIEKYGENQEIGFPNTAYYLPIIYAMMGIQGRRSSKTPSRSWSAASVAAAGPGRAQLPALPGTRPGRRYGHPVCRRNHRGHPLPGRPEFLCRRRGSLHKGASNIWLGAADDIILRKRGVEFVDGTAPGFAAIVGAAPVQEAVDLATEFQKKNLYVFMCANPLTARPRFPNSSWRPACRSAGRPGLVSFGPDISGRGLRPGFCHPRRHVLRRRRARRTTGRS